MLKDHGDMVDLFVSVASTSNTAAHREPGLSAIRCRLLLAYMLISPSPLAMSDGDLLNLIFCKGDSIGIFDSCNEPRINNGLFEFSSISQTDSAHLISHSSFWLVDQKL
jgi:hypothetical protein